MDYKSRYHVIITCQGSLWYLQRTLLIFSKPDIHVESLGFETFYSKPMMKISIITNISVLRFYRYIRNIEKISVERKLFKIYRNAWENSKKNDKISKNSYFKVIL